MTRSPGGDAGPAGGGDYPRAAADPLPRSERPSAGDRPMIKICGITRPEDAERAVELGASMIGLNFYPGSPRCLTPRRAAAVARAVDGRAKLVGVFVDADPATVDELARQIGLDLLQFHGSEPAAEVESFGRRALRVLRVDPWQTGEISAQLVAPYPSAWGFLFDIHHPVLAGGSGQAWSYGSLAAVSSSVARPVLVAGGIGPDNARRALAVSGASGIDVCSRIESSPGVKDPVLLARLFAEVFDGESSAQP